MTKEEKQKQKRLNNCCLQETYITGIDIHLLKNERIRNDFPRKSNLKASRNNYFQADIKPKLVRRVRGSKNI
jgi:hypothetical protein